MWAVVMGWDGMAGGDGILGGDGEPKASKRAGIVLAMQYHACLLCAEEEWVHFSIAA